MLHDFAPNKLSIGFIFGFASFHRGFHIATNFTITIAGLNRGCDGIINTVEKAVTDWGSSPARLSVTYDILKIAQNTNEKTSLDIATLPVWFGSMHQFNMICRLQTPCFQTTSYGTSWFTTSLNVVGVEALF